jgi:hypothetical protein
MRDPQSFIAGILFGLSPFYIAVAVLAWRALTCGPRLRKDEETPVHAAGAGPSSHPAPVAGGRT